MIGDIQPSVHNVVVTVGVGCQLDLKHIASRARNSEYNPKRFAAVVMRIRQPKTTALIFASGKMVVTGAKTQEDARQASRKFRRILVKLGYNAELQSPTIQNMVASCDVGFTIRLEGLALAQFHSTTYEPELFPGLIFRMRRPQLVLLVFVSGKVVFTGAKNAEEINEAFRLIHPILKGTMCTRMFIVKTNVSRSSMLDLEAPAIAGHLKAV